MCGYYKENLATVLTKPKKDHFLIKILFLIPYKESSSCRKSIVHVEAYLC